MTPRMAGRRDCQQVVVYCDGVFTLDDLLNAEPGGAITSVHDSDCAKFLRKTVVIGDVVTVRQKYPANAAQLGDLLYKVACKAWRID